AAGLALLVPAGVVRADVLKDLALQAPIADLSGDGKGLLVQLQDPVQAALHVVHGAEVEQDRGLARAVPRLAVEREELFGRVTSLVGPALAGVHRGQAVQPVDLALAVAQLAVDRKGLEVEIAGLIELARAATDQGKPMQAAGLSTAVPERLRFRERQVVFGMGLGKAPLERQDPLRKLVAGFDALGRGPVHKTKIGSVQRFGLRMSVTRRRLASPCEEVASGLFG